MKKEIENNYNPKNKSFNYSSKYKELEYLDNKNTGFHTEDGLFSISLFFAWFLWFLWFIITLQNNNISIRTVESFILSNLLLTGFVIIILISIAIFILTFKKK